MSLPFVLVIDGSLSVRVNLQHALMAAGLDVVACDGSAAGRRALQSRAPALIVVDAAVLDSDGGALLRDAHSETRWGGIPIVVLSSDSGATARILRLTATAVDYIGKPASPIFVVRRVQRLLGLENSASGVGAFNAQTPARILLVDAIHSIGIVFAERLRVEGHDVVLAKSVQEALGLLEVQSVDCIVLDPPTSGSSGIEMARRIRTGRGASLTPLLLLTQREDTTAPSIYASAGIDDSIIKSGDMTDMVARLGEFVRRTSSNSSGMRIPARVLESSRTTTNPGAPVPNRPTDIPPSGSEFSPLFEQVLEVSGLQDRVGRGGLRRALERAGVEPKTATAQGIERAMPEIRKTLSIFLSKEEVAHAEQLIVALLGKGTRATLNSRGTRNAG